jgi:hypothetical protein
MARGLITFAADHHIAAEEQKYRRSVCAIAFRMKVPA